MPDTPLQGPLWESVCCMEDVAGAIQRLPAKLGDAGAEPPSLVNRLEALLLQGAFAEALTLCRAQVALAPGQVFVPLIRRVDARWQRDEIGFGDLAFVFFQVRRLIDLLREPAAPVAAWGGGLAMGRILLGMAPGEGHTFGIQIVCGELTMQGWQVDIVRDANPGALHRQLEARAYDCVGLTVGHDGALDGLADLIASARIVSCNPAISVIVGGAALVEPVSRYNFLGADRICLTTSDAAMWLASRHARTFAEVRN